MKIMVVDDSKTSRVVLETFLKKDGHEVTLATNGSEAINMLRERKTTFHLIFLDWQMPEMDGLSFVMSIRNEKLSGPYIVLLTGDKDENRIQKIMFLGKDVKLIDYIAKPYSKEKIENTINTVTHRLKNPQLDNIKSS